MPTVPLTTVLQNRQVFLLDPIHECIRQCLFDIPILVDGYEQDMVLTVHGCN